MDIIFLNSKTGEQLTMPVTPSEFRVEIGRAVTQLDMAQTGQVNLPGLEALFNEQQTFLLPSSARNYTSAGYGGDPLWDCGYPDAVESIRRCAADDRHRYAGESAGSAGPLCATASRTARGMSM